MSKKTRKQKIIRKKRTPQKEAPVQPSETPPMEAAAKEENELTTPVTETVKEEILEEPAEPPAPAEKPSPVEEEIEIVEERMLPINLGRVWNTPRTQRAPKAIRTIREAVKKHMKVAEVKISGDVNEKVWFRGIEKPPRRIEVRAVKDKEGNVIVFTAR